MEYGQSLSGYKNEEEEILDDGLKVEDGIGMDFTNKNNFEIQKYLYESGLQNIFNDYQKNISNLDKNKQKEIQDAYYVKELSKKYLGEYASNQDIGDVSGNLLSIYGQYQDNINDINANFGELEFGLENAYLDKKNEYELGLMDTEMQMNNAKQEEIRQKELGEIMYNFKTEMFPDGMNSQEYLDSVRDKIGEQAYWEISAENKLIDMNDVVNENMGKTNDYKDKASWDEHVDSLLKDGSISSKQSDYMKNMYDVEQNTNFKIMDKKDFDFSYLNPDVLDINQDGKVYQSRNGEYILFETNTTVDESTGLYNELHEKGKDMAYDTPFGHNGKWYSKITRDGEQYYVELAKGQDQNNLTNKGTIGDKEESQKEAYKEIDGKLGKKDGTIMTGSGMKSYKYNSETDEYTSYLNFDVVPNSVGGEKGEYVINGINYRIDKKNKTNGRGGIIDVKDKWKNGDWKGSYNDKKNVKPIIDVFIKEYFDGDKSKFSDYVENRKNGKSSETVAIVEYSGKYYTINDGELWELSKK